MSEKKSIPVWKWFLAAVGVAYLVGGAVWLAFHIAPDGETPGPSELALHPERQEEILAQRRADELAGKLGLDAEQAAEMAAVMRDMQQQRKSLMREHGGDRVAMAMNGMQMMQDMQERARAILTDEQYAAFETEMNDRVSRLMEAGRRFRPEGMEPGELTPTQRRGRLMRLFQSTPSNQETTE